MITGSIYIIRNTVNQKVYIGQTTMTVRERFMSHMKPSTSKTKRNYKLYNAVLKYGRDKFFVETLEENIPLSEINEKEIYYIQKYNSFFDGYNSTKGGDGRIFNYLDNDSEVLLLAKSGTTAKEIANIYHVNEFTVLRTLHRLGFYYHQVDEKQILSLSKKGLKNSEIAKIVGVHVQTVSRVLNRNSARKYRNHIQEDLIPDIVSDYKNQVPISEICEKHKISKTTFYRIKKSLSLPSRPQVYKYKTYYKD